MPEPSKLTPTDRYVNLTDALEIISFALLEVQGHDETAWRYLNRVTKHLEAQQAQAFRDAFREEEVA